MQNQYSIEPMLDSYIYDTSQFIERLEQIILTCEKSNSFKSADIDEIFRIMHTIKGSSAMMLFNNISSLSHAMEDLFFYIREKKIKEIDFSKLSDLVFECIDFIKVELEKIKNGDNSDGDVSIQINNIELHLAALKSSNTTDDTVSEKEQPTEKKQQYYIRSEKTSRLTNLNDFKATVYFQEDSEMENIRAYTIIHNLKDIAEEYCFFPENIIENADSAEIIRNQGFTIWFSTSRTYEEMHEFFMQTIFLEKLELSILEDKAEIEPLFEDKKSGSKDAAVIIPKLPDKESPEKETHVDHQSIISVQLEKLDKLMDLVGELVISEAMVTQNPDLNGLQLDNFQKAARQLKKITGELQDTVMSIRMVSLAATFRKMNRIVRDMSKKLNKEVDLEIIGEETEVDKNIIERISSPLMHLVRNAVDHGIEFSAERSLNGKTEPAKITLEAKNAGGDVLVSVKDNGRGLNKEKIIEKAGKNGLLSKSENEMTDREAFDLIFLPGFSTKEGITEFSGRGVGMDVVAKNIETVGGSVAVESTAGVGTTVTLKIPLTLAIIDGMNIKVGNSCYTIPIASIIESFRPLENEIITDPDNNEMIMVRGQCFPVIRLHELYNIKSDILQIHQGIIVLVENNGKIISLFADELLGEQQVVVKALPAYIRNSRKIKGLAGCTLLGDGSISLILDIGGLMA